MSAASIATAMREMQALFSAVWAPRDGALIDWPNSKFTIPGDKSLVWARWRVQHELFGQNSLANVNGQRKFGREGTLYIQLFFPLNAGVIDAYNFAEDVVKAYEGKRTASDVWFRNVRINEALRDSIAEGSEPTDLWMQFLVIADFLYDQIH